MTEYLILAEKPSAAQHFAKALGGTSGTFEGHSYKIVHAVGHVMTLDEPAKQVSSDKSDKYASWNPNDMPWNLDEMKFKKVVSKGKTNVINTIKTASKNADSIVIATDNDPSGEGELLAWEVINKIGWKKKVLRMFFADESKPSIIKAMKDLKDVSDQQKDGDFLKSDVRNKWDFGSMQLTRLATSYARNAGYSVRVSNQGRLKSVIVSKVYEQLDAIKNYVKTPYYEVKFKDDNGHVFGRKFGKDADTSNVRFNSKDDADHDMKNYQDSSIDIVSKTKKKSAPGALLDLSSLSSILNTKGYSSKEVLDTYQKMYEAEFVSYPRTEDKKITLEQFNQMVPIVNKIASVVGVDPKLLTHKTPRKSHVSEGGAHGANRPGLKVPSSLDSLSKFGKSAKDIYVTLSKNFLAMFGEDYVYMKYDARIHDYPKFITSVSVPLELNYKKIFDTDSSTSDNDKKQDISGQFDSLGKPFIYEGANKKPSKPTTNWIMKFLEKNEIGTGATRTSTIAELTSGRSPLLNEKRGALSMTDPGNVTAVMAKNTFIASPKVTKQLFDAMDQVGSFKQKPNVVLHTLDQVIQHDMPVMKQNANDLHIVLGEPSAKMKGFAPKKKITGVYAPTGSEVSFNSEWSSHKFTKDEVAKLLKGENISFKATSKSGKTYTAKGKLQKQSYKGKSFFGFKADFG